MKYSGEQQLHVTENLIYLFLWLLVFCIPVWGEYKYADDGVSWRNILHTWLTIVPIFLVFIINNYILLPLFLLKKKRIKTYIFFAGCLIAALVLLNLSSEPKDRLPEPPNRNRPPVSINENRPKPDQPEKEMPGKERRTPPNLREQGEGSRHEGEFPDLPLEPPLFHFSILPIPIFLSPVILGLLMIGVNVGIKFVFKSINDDARLKDLEKNNLHNELEYLKQQINPHFFMNTLNNIHALIDINSEKAKETVLELSKMMRYVLYETTNSLVSLEKEIQFLDNYIKLMKLRYLDEIDISVSVPPVIPQLQVPPLLFIPFVENAFKHGISYRNQSFIHISMDVEEDNLRFLICNSKFKKPANHRPGIGLENVRKRLDLIYGKKYTLDIQSEENEYHVLLLIPLQYDSMHRN